jgi:hypothetical protein
MALLLKEKARKPVMDQAAAVGSLGSTGGKVGYRIDLYQGRDRSHYLIMDRAEMLAIVSSWMAGGASRSGRQKAARPSRSLNRGTMIAAHGTQGQLANEAEAHQP